MDPSHPLVAGISAEDLYFTRDRTVISGDNKKSLKDVIPPSQSEVSAAAAPDWSPDRIT